MTLRLRLFALLGALATLLVAGEWALVRGLSADLERELGVAAASVGTDVLRQLSLDDLPLAPPAGPSTGGLSQANQRVIIVRDARTNDTPSPGHPPRAWKQRVETLQLRVVDGEPKTMVLRGPRAAMRLPVPTSGVETAVTGFRRRLLLASLALAAAALLLGLAVTHRFTRPLRELAGAARRVGEGDLGVAVPSAPGEVGEAITAFNQMSRRLRALDEETRRLRASEQLSELGEVGRGLAHSLRNPLHALGLALDELAAGAGAAAAETATGARRQIRRIDAALRGFLALSAADAAATPVDLGAVAHDVALEVAQARPPGEPIVSVVVEPAGERPHVVGVEAELRAALQALVVNAVEASPPGGTVSIALRREGGQALLIIDDAGSGVPATVRARLFTPHVTTKSAGAGIGLYLAHRLATTRYGGSLSLADRHDGGTRAILRLRDRGARSDPSTATDVSPAMGDAVETRRAG